MNIYQNTPYTYRIYWTKTGMNYYGVRYAKDCHPSDLFVTYFTSSAYVAQYIKEHGLPDIIEVRKTFTSEDRVNQSIIHEHRVLTRMRVVERADFLNLNDKLGYPNSPAAIAKRMATRNDPTWIESHKGVNSKKADTTVYDWEHVDGTKISCSRTELCVRYELIQKYSLDSHILGKVVNKRRPSHKGWQLAAMIMPCLLSLQLCLR